MMLLAKLALCVGSTVVLAGAYTFREGLIRVDVDEYRGDGSHVHVWLPAAAVPMAVHFIPARQLDKAAFQANEWMPTARTMLKELKKFPDTNFVEVIDGAEHVRVRTERGKLRIDVTSPDENVHILCPLATLEDLSAEIENRAPAA